MFDLKFQLSLEKINAVGILDRFATYFETKLNFGP